MKEKGQEAPQGILSFFPFYAEASLAMLKLLCYIAYSFFCF